MLASQQLESGNLGRGLTHMKESVKDCQERNLLLPDGKISTRMWNFPIPIPIPIAFSLALLFHSPFLVKTGSCSSSASDRKTYIAAVAQHHGFSV